MQTRDIAIIGVLVVVGLLLVTLLGGGMMGPGMMGWYGLGGSTGAGAWWGVGMMFFSALLLVGLVGLVVWAARAGPPAPVGPGGSLSRAKEILKERYARGELTRDEYERMRPELKDK